MKIVTLPLALLSAFALTACGGGSSSSDIAPPATPSKLAAYAGTWVLQCLDHGVQTLTVVASTSPDTVSVMPRTEYFSQSNCTGTVVATVTRTTEAFKYERTIDARVVFNPGESAVMSKVDLVTLSRPETTVSVTGPGAVHTTRNGRAQWCMDFTDGVSKCINDDGLLPAAQRAEFPMHLNANQWSWMNVTSTAYEYTIPYTRR